VIDAGVDFEHPEFAGLHVGRNLAISASISRVEWALANSIRLLAF
jgi:hypothetical protein